jgi:hypothetical protein
MGDRSSAGSGKSYLGIAWIIMSALKYPGSRWVIARSRLSVLKNTTVKTFMDMVTSWGLEDKVSYHLFNNKITFSNGTEILLLDLFYFPNDPDFNRLGSLEITGALIDEGSEITEKAFTILGTRIRYKLDEFGLLGKMFIVSNPARGHLYNQFYKADKDGTLPPYRKFIKALPTDNPHLPKTYIETLKRLPKIDRMRLYEGLWEFSVSDFDIFEVDALYNMFHNTSVDREGNFITVDVASTGKDSTVITTWDGLYCSNVFKYNNIDTPKIVSEVRRLMNIYTVPIKHVIIDTIGVGSGVGDLLKGCVRFVAGSKPLNKETFNHIKSQLFFHLARLINSGEIGVNYEGAVDDIVDELVAHKRHNADKDGKYQVTPKDEVKRLIGRSPDIGDAIVMRAFFTIKKKSSIHVL